MTIIATVVIPTYNRQDKTERAIASVLCQAKSEKIQIVVVDDASDIPFRSAQLRRQDICLRNNRNVGGAVSRNRGIAEAKGELIFLLDSDDYFLEQDFDALYQEYQNTPSPGIWYCDMLIRGKRRRFPNSVTAENFLAATLWKHSPIGQTSTLVFPARLGLRFDESLPKHQDWDFVYCALLSGISVKRKAGLVFFDRSDTTSLSKSYAPQKSLPWCRKLTELAGRYSIDLESVRFHLFAFYSDQLPLLELGRLTWRLLLSRRTSPKFILKVIYYRLCYLISPPQQASNQ